MGGKWALYQDDIESKVCRKCDIEKPISEFNWRDKNYRHECKECLRQQAKDNLLMRFYKMTREDYNSLLELQGEVCAICKLPKYEYRNLAVDHNHTCCPGEKSCGLCIRGILCSNCNCGIGSFTENVLLLKNAINYLVNYKPFIPIGIKEIIQTNDILYRSWINDIYADYKLSVSEYYLLEKIQNGACAICKSPPRGKKRLSIDHDHNTLVIRGLLCMPCNSGLGYFKDNIVTIENAIDYLNNPFKDA